MLNSNVKIIKHKVGLLNLAEELGNASKACKVMGLSRDTFYRYMGHKCTNGAQMGSGLAFHGAQMHTNGVKHTNGVTQMGSGLAFCFLSLVTMYYLEKKRLL